MSEQRMHVTLSDWDARSYRQIAGPPSNPDYTIHDVANWQLASPEKLNMMLLDGLNLLAEWMEDWRIG